MEDTQAQEALELLNQAIAEGKKKLTAAAGPGNGVLAGREGRRCVRKVAIHLGYNGYGYHGMQVNPGVKTIESEMLDALAKTGCIAESDKTELGNIRWIRAARTDKGVSAIGQVVSARLDVGIADLTARVNVHLPEAVKVFGIKRATDKFDARMLCDKRRYEFLIPEWVFDPDLFPDRPGWRPEAHSPNAGILAPEELDSAASCTLVSQQPDGSSARLRVRRGYHLDGPPSESSFRFDDECVARLNRILGGYVGTHNYHNFSPNVQPMQMAAQRCMISFGVVDMVNVSVADMPSRWVRTQVVGQSFLLNQIRKMVGMAIAVFRGTAPEDGIHLALDPNCDFSTPLAPALGLLLVECIYDRYNEKWAVNGAGGKGEGDEEAADGTAEARPALGMADYAVEVEAFKRKLIYPDLPVREARDSDFYTFMKNLTDDRFLFSTWRTAKPVRHLKRPRTKEEKEMADALYRRKLTRIDELMRCGMDRIDARRKATEELAAEDANEQAQPSIPDDGAEE